MALWDKDKKEKAPGEKHNGADAPDNQAPDRMKEIRNLSGFSSLDDVAETARDIVNESARKQGERKKFTPRQKEELEAAAKEAKRKLALETLGRFFCRELTVIPYDMWAKFYNDPVLRLTPEEATKLTEATFLVVQGFDIDFSSPWIGLLGLVLMHAAAIGHRIQHQITIGIWETEDGKKKPAGSTGKPAEEKVN